MEGWVNVISINAQAFFSLLSFSSPFLFASFISPLHWSDDEVREIKMEKSVMDSMKNKRTEAPTKIIIIASIVRVYTKHISFFFYFAFIYLSVLLLFVHVACCCYAFAQCFFFISILLSSARSLTLNLVFSHSFRYLHIKCHTDIWCVCVYALAALCLFHA